MKPLVYIAGPYSKPNPVTNTREASVVWHRLWATGVIAPVCPHLSLFLDYLQVLPYEDWLQYDFELLRRCDAVLRIPGESPGAEREIAFANKHGIPVFTDEAALIEWASAQEAA